MSDDEPIDGIYNIAMWISSGGSSQVLECVEQQTGRHVAMKLLKQDSPDFKENRGVMKHEAEVMKTLDHPLIIKFERFSSSRDYTYIVMEHFRAANVKLQLKSDIKSVHIRARKLFEGVCQALAHVHGKGWIHRDIKPDNVLMNKVGEIRLVDFSLACKEVKGLSKMMGGGKQKIIQGTRTYIAPETIRKQTPVLQTDLYSLGILFFEVLTGRTPFQAPSPEELLMRHLRDEPPNPSEFNPNVTPEMDRLVFRMLKKKPTDRPASVEEVLGELRRIRIFKEDVVEVTAEEEEAKSQSMEVLTDVRLDSRADAKLSVMLQANPELARQFAAEKQAKSQKKKTEAARVAEQAKAMKEAAGKKSGAAPPQMQPPMMPVPMPMPGYMPQPQFGAFPQPPQFGMPPTMMPPGIPSGMPPGMPAGMPTGMPSGMPPGMAPPGMAGGMPPGIPAAGPPGFPAPGFSQPNPFGVPGMAPPIAGPPGVVAPSGLPGMPAPGFPLQASIPGAPVFGGPPVPVAPQMPPSVPRPAAPAPAVGVPGAAARPAPPAQPPASKPAPPARSPAPAQPAVPSKPAANPDEMEYMTELPDIL